MATKRNDMLVLSPEYLKKAGIEINNTEKAASAARAAMIASNGGRGYVPQNKASDLVVQLMDYARQELKAGENANRRVCVALASVDMAKAYETAHDATGKPYTSMLTFAMDLLPDLSKSTVASYLSVGRNIYVPAINNRFGVSSKILLNLPPSTLDAVKANLSDDNTRGDTIEVLKAASKKDGKVTQRLAKNIAKVVRDRAAMENKPAMSAAELLKAAQGDAGANDKIYGQKAHKTGGTTANGGNAESAAAASDEKRNVLVAKLKEYMQVTHDPNTGNVTISMDEKQAANLSGLLKKAMVNTSDNAAAQIMLSALVSVIG